MKTVAIKAYPKPCSKHETQWIRLNANKVTDGREKAAGIKEYHIELITCPACQVTTVNGAVTFYEAEDTR